MTHSLKITEKNLLALALIIEERRGAGEDIPATLLFETEDSSATFYDPDRIKFYALCPRTQTRIFLGSN